jgi:AcrR family transcriptional regulator
MAVEESRSAGESTRQQLLDSARALVLERFREGVAPHHALAYLTPAAVAARAGVSRGTIYHYWGSSSQDGDDRPFERFLAEVAQLLYDDSVDVEDLDLLASVLPDNLTDLILELCGFELARLSNGDDAAMFRASTTMALHGVDLSPQYRGSIDQLAVVYDLGLARLGRRVRAPLTTRDLAQAIASLTGGMLLEELFDPGGATREIDWEGSVPRVASERSWTTYSIAVEALVLHLTEPV